MSSLLILEGFGPDIQHISGVDNIVADIISIFSSTTIDQDEHITTRSLSQSKTLFTKRVKTYRWGYIFPRPHGSSAITTKIDNKQKQYPCYIHAVSEIP